MWLLITDCFKYSGTKTTIDQDKVSEERLEVYTQANGDIFSELHMTKSSTILTM